MTDNIKLHGFTAVPLDPETFFSQYKSSKNPLPTLATADLTTPTTPLASTIASYAQQTMRAETFHHSMRVYHFGRCILDHHLPSFSDTISDETWFLACMLHDIGTAAPHLRGTFMSFEFFGGFLAHGKLVGEGSPQAQAEAVTEAVIRHQDLGSSGKITALGQVLQLATVFDNTGSYADLVNEETVKAVVGKWPRLKWSGCFASTVKEEMSLKPWAHTTKLGEEEFPKMILGNKRMEPYD